SGSVSAKKPSAAITDAISVAEPVKCFRSGGRYARVTVIENASPNAPRPRSQTSLRRGATAFESSRRLGEPERGGQREQVRQRALLVRMLPCAVEQERAHAERPRAGDVVLERVADHRRLRRLDAEPLEHRAEDRGVGLRLSVLP